VTRTDRLRIGIDLGGTKIEGVVLDDDGRARARKRIPAPRGDYQRTIDATVGLVRALEGSAGATATVGVGIPGAISTATGLVKNANSTWLIGHPLGDDLTRAIGRPVRLANDANCFALSEATDGAAAGAAVVFGVILGTGVGGGIVVNQRAWAGCNAIAGEWGHNPLPSPHDAERPGRACYCGRTGCIETFLSGPGMTADYIAFGGHSTDAREIVALAASGEPAALACLARYEDRLARALAGIINVLDPEVIVLGGGLSNIERLYTSIPDRWGACIFSDRISTRLVRAAHGDSSGVRGAAWLWDVPQRCGRG
jgi:fructokinase